MKKEQKAKEKNEFNNKRRLEERKVGNNLCHKLGLAINTQHMC